MSSKFGTFKDTAVTSKQLSRVSIPKAIKSGKTEYYQDLYREYQVLAKRADQRLRELEKVQHQKGFENVTKWGYARAQRDVKAWTGQSDKVRFGKSTPETTTGLKAKLEDVKSFLESATSSKSKIVSMYKDRADEINKKYGTSFSWDQMGNFFESKMWQNMNEKYGSKTAMKAIADQMDDDRPDHESTNDKLAAGEQAKIDEILSKYGDEIRDFFHD